jgi:hypothetical protein
VGGRFSAWVLVCVVACSGHVTAVPDASGNPACEPSDFDSNNCGACGHVCGATEVCFNGACQSVCANGLSLCGTACADLATDVNNCGACSKKCNSTRANVACVSGVCNITCRKSGANCDGDPSNGCEVDLDVDSKNCGACGHDCLGGPCMAGKCQPLVLATGEKTPWGIAIDATSIYWTTYDTIRSCAKNNCVPTTLASNQQFPRGITTDASNVYWTTATNVQQCPKNNCTSPNVLATAQAPLGVATDGTDVFFAASGGGVVQRCAVSGCNNLPTTLVSPFQPYYVAIDKQNLFLTSQDGVRQCAFNSCGPTLKVITYSGAYGLALDATNVYFTTNGQVQKCAVSGCGSPTTLATSGALALAVDATDVYWAGANSTIQKCATGGCNEMPTTIATGQLAPYALAVDSTAVYWTSYSSGTVSRLAK